MVKKVLIAICVLVIVGILVPWMSYAMRNTAPKGVKVVENLEAGRYVGQWYEIARFDFHWEKNLDKVTANYSLRPDGDITVVNSGYDVKKKDWYVSKGKAKFVESPTVGKLKVSFFGPFYGGYNIVSVDDDYSYALVFGRNTDYMWILSRYKEIPDEIREKYLRMASDAGYDLSRLIWTVQ